MSFYRAVSAEGCSGAKPSRSLQELFNNGALWCSKLRFSILNVIDHTARRMSGV
jgi:hypothetical protein